jgi:tRNA-splicing ligase RtcB (3'-phosphate/5'-hydroxy nucleic acid ligase)
MKGWGRKARIVAPGKVSEEMMQGWLKERGVILKGGGLDEAPQAYRRLPEVLSAQGDTIRVRHVLKPLIVVMAGADELDL